MAECHPTIQAQIDAQKAAIADLEAQLATASPREKVVLEAQIEARQQVVDDLTASC